MRKMFFHFSRKKTFSRSRWLHNIFVFTQANTTKLTIQMGRRLNMTRYILLIFSSINMLLTLSCEEQGLSLTDEQHKRDSLDPVQLSALQRSVQGNFSRCGITKTNSSPCRIFCLRPSFSTTRLSNEKQRKNVFKTL